ncbi:cysteine protease ATG4C-like isoform X3 [Cyprinus carpio]|uniref:Cysteine protease n=1 Tax=Cyprinus carpio TaxID=7962 RepID=A0A9Q9Y624_CYPCA|nr:cysteine protease ATG4C-like isoform X3 [Cyprinus carpio]
MCCDGFCSVADKMETKETDEVEKLKSKLMSAWHNVKYSWVLKSKTAFSRNSPVFLLGKCYHFTAVDDESPTESCTAEALDDDVVTDWTWSEAMTLEPLDTETWTSSAARRLVATLEASIQGERVQVTQQPLCAAQGGAKEADSYLQEAYHRTIVSWFGDGPSALLGIHRLVQLGMTSGKRAGDWYGPAVMAHILRKAVDEAVDAMLKGISVYVAQDCTVYSADVIDSHSGQTGSHSDPQGLNSEAAPDSRAVIILIPVRLGGEKINPEYLSFVKSILSLEYCIGIIGGKPKQAYYFVGFQDDSLIYMDPHYCQSFVDVSTSDFPLQSFHCPSPKKMPFSKMDPSCTIGFYSKNVEHYERISTELSKILQPSSKEKYPAFTFMKGHGKDYELSTGIEKREWPFIRDTRKAGTTLGDFVLL